MNIICLGIIVHCAEIAISGNQNAENRNKQTLVI